MMIIMVRVMSATTNENELRQKWQALVAEQVESLRFGVVQIVVHDSQVVQIERTEKVRLDAPATGRPDKRP